MTEAVVAGPGERTAGRLGFRAGYYNRGLVTRIGKLELRVPRDRDGRYSTELFARYQRSEKALVSALAEMYVQGVSTRKVKANTEELCGHTLAVAVGALRARLDGPAEGGFFPPQCEDCPLTSCGVFGADGVVELAGGGALFPAGAAVNDSAAYGGRVPAGGGVGVW